MTWILIMIVGPMLVALVFGRRMRNNRRLPAKIRRGDETKRIGREEEHRDAKTRVEAGPDGRGAAHRAAPPVGS